MFFYSIRHTMDILQMDFERTFEELFLVVFKPSRHVIPLPLLLPTALVESQTLRSDCALIALIVVTCPTTNLLL